LIRIRRPFRIPQTASSALAKNGDDATVPTPADINEINAKFWEVESKKAEQHMKDPLVRDIEIAIARYRDWAATSSWRVILSPQGAQVI
jgi:hypothetical protein